MSQGDVELLRRLRDAWNAGGEIDVGKFFHPDVEFVPLRSETEGHYRGLAGIEAFRRDTNEVFDKFEFHHEYEDLGDVVIVWGHNHVRTKSGELETDVPIGGLMEFRDGKIVRWEDFGSKAKALEAAGRRG